VGQSSVVADKIVLEAGRLPSDESGFGADIGFEKFWNVKCRLSGNTPNVSVITTTIRGLKPPRSECRGAALPAGQADPQGVLPGEPGLAGRRDCAT